MFALSSEDEDEVRLGSLTGRRRSTVAMAAGTLARLREVPNAFREALVSGPASISVSEVGKGTVTGRLRFFCRRRVDADFLRLRCCDFDFVVTSSSSSSVLPPPRLFAS